MSSDHAANHAEDPLRSSVLRHILSEAGVIVADCAAQAVQAAADAIADGQVGGSDSAARLCASATALAVSQWALTQLSACAGARRLGPSITGVWGEASAKDRALAGRAARLHERAARLDRLLRGEDDSTAPMAAAPPRLRLVSDTGGAI